MRKEGRKEDCGIAECYRASTSDRKSNLTISIKIPLLREHFWDQAGGTGPRVIPLIIRLYYVRPFGKGGWLSLV